MKSWFEQSSHEQWKAVTKALVDTLSVNTMKEQAEIEVPDVEVTTKRNHYRNRKTAGMYDMDNIKTDVNSRLKTQALDFVGDNRQSCDKWRRSSFVYSRKRRKRQDFHLRR